MAPGDARFADDPPPWAQAVRRRTAALRVLPDLVIIGAMRSGTTTLHDLLVGAPDVLGAGRKEVHHFDRDPVPDLAAYRAWFPTHAEVLLRTVRRRVRPRVIEATPSYLLAPGAPAALGRALPDAVALVLLRHPTDRAISHWRFLRGIGDEHLGVREALAAEDAGEPITGGRRTRPRTYLARSRYDELLPRWLEALGSRRVVALRSEDLFADPLTTVNRARGAMGLEPVQRTGSFRRNETRTAGADADELAAVRATLDARFAATIERTLELVGIDLRRAPQAR